MQVGNMSRRVLPAVAAGLVGAAAAGGGIAIASSSSGGSVHACVSKQTHVVTVQKECNKKTSTSLTWAKRGPAGPRGATGPTGAPGQTGQTGPAGLQGPAGSAQAWGTYAGSPINEHNLSIGTPSAGVFPVTASVCQSNATVIATPESFNIPAGDAPMAYVDPGNSPNVFNVVTGYLEAGSFHPQSENLDVAVYC